MLKPIVDLKDVNENDSWNAGAKNCKSERKEQVLARMWASGAL